MEVFHDTARERLLNEMHELLHVAVNLLHGGSLHFGHQRVPLTKLVFEMLWATETFELPIDHDSNAGAESFTFFHAVDK